MALEAKISEKQTKATLTLWASSWSCLEKYFSMLFDKMPYAMQRPMET